MQHIHFSHFGSNYFLFNFFRSEWFRKGNGAQKENHLRQWRLVRCAIYKNISMIKYPHGKISCHMIINVPRKRWCSATAHWSSPVLSLNWSVGFITWTVWHTHSNKRIVIQWHVLQRRLRTFCDTQFKYIFVDNMLACARAQARD